MPLWFRITKSWVPLAIVLTVACGFAYVGVQQSFRMSANYPQIQLAEDAAAKLDSGSVEADVVPDESVNMASSLAPFVIVYSAQNEVLRGSGVLDGGPPTPPAGVLDAARASRHNAVTWQPQPSVRIATVSVATKDGRVVLAGRSLREVETRIGDINQLAAAAWIAGLLATLAAVAVLDALSRRWDVAR